MSELVPEVDDVWKLHGHLMRMLRVGKEYDTEYTYALIKLRGEVLAIGSYTASYIKSVGTYIGKSKANINQLFEVKDDK